jgi:hypothetical protein
MINVSLIIIIFSIHTLWYVRLSSASMRGNISKYESFAEQIEYLGYWIIRQGIQPICNQVEINAILNIKVTKTRKKNQLRQFIGIVNYYRDMWFLRSELQAWLD